MDARASSLEATATPQEDKTPVYSPGQVKAGTFLGGPLVGIYFLYRTFKGMGQEASASKTLTGGLIFVIALAALLPFLPSRFPNIVIPLAYALIAESVAKRFQLKKPEILGSDRYRLVSNWRVAAQTLAGLIIFLIVIFGEVFLILSIRGRT